MKYCALSRILFSEAVCSRYLWLLVWATGPLGAQEGEQGRVRNLVLIHARILL